MANEKIEYSTYVRAMTVLNLPLTATQEEITRRYRRLAKVYHPDHNPDNPEAVEYFRVATLAKQIANDYILQNNIQNERRKEPENQEWTRQQYTKYQEDREEQTVYAKQPRQKKTNIDDMGKKYNDDVRRAIDELKQMMEEKKKAADKTRRTKKAAKKAAVNDPETAAKRDEERKAKRRAAAKARREKKAAEKAVAMANDPEFAAAEERRQAEIRQKRLESLAKARAVRTARADARKAKRAAQEAAARKAAEDAKRQAEEAAARKAAEDAKRQAEEDAERDAIARRKADAERKAAINRAREAQLDLKNQEHYIAWVKQTAAQQVAQQQTKSTSNTSYVRFSEPSVTQPSRSPEEIRRSNEEFMRTKGAAVRAQMQQELGKRAAEMAEQKARNQKIFEQQRDAEKTEWTRTQEAREARELRAKNYVDRVVSLESKLFYEHQNAAIKLVEVRYGVPRPMDWHDQVKNLKSKAQSLKKLHQQVEKMAKVARKNAHKDTFDLDAAIDRLDAIEMMRPTNRPSQKTTGTPMSSFRPTSARPVSNPQVQPDASAERVAAANADISDKKPSGLKEWMAYLKQYAQAKDLSEQKKEYICQMQKMLRTIQKLGRVAWVTSAATAMTAMTAFLAPMMADFVNNIATLPAEMDVELTQLAGWTGMTTLATLLLILAEKIGRKKKTFDYLANITFNDKTR